jgi:hypothetical protein
VSGLQAEAQALMAIPFTQYLLPNGRRERVTIDRPPEIEALAQKALDAGVRFEAEILTTGQVSFEALLPEGGEDGEPLTLAMEIVANGPAVPRAIDDLVTQAATSILSGKVVPRWKEKLPF